MACGVKVLTPVLVRILAHARTDWPLECCGLLAGRHEVITSVFPAPNAMGSAREFFIAPQELASTFRAIRQLGLKHLGIYHSHPEGENAPSRRDIEMAFYPSCTYFVISPKAPASCIRAFRIANGQAAEIEILPTPPEMDEWKDVRNVDRRGKDLHTRFR
ncbi:MAG: M67 family metallopeptidase [Terriglobia bacterium]